MLKRLRPLDRVLLLTLMPLWLACFTLGLRSLAGGRAHHAGLGLSLEHGDSYPIFTGDFNPVAHPAATLIRTGLRPGDRLIRIGNADLRGVGTLGFSARSVEEAEPDATLRIVFDRDGERLETTLDLAPISVRRSQMAAALALVLSGVFFLLRGKPTPTLSAYFYFAMCWAFLFAFHQTRHEFYAWVSILVLANTLLFPLAFRFLLLFPDDCPPEGRWNRIWPWLFAVQGLFAALAFSRWMAVGETGFGTTAGVGAVIAVLVATQKYRLADPIARRQMKWVLFGVYCVALPLGISIALPALDPRFGWLWYPGAWLVPLIPLALFVSVLRFNVFDIDRILSSAASYNILLVLLAAGVLAAVPRLARTTSALAGLDPETGQLVLSLGLAALMLPVHRRLRPQIDRLFFRERYAIDHGIAGLLRALSACRDPRELTEGAGAGLQGLFQPEVCVVYAAGEEGYAPVFVEGRAVPPTFVARSPLIASLEEHRGPLSLSDAGRRADEPPLGGFDRAALATLQAEVVVPVLHDRVLVAFLCLGPKRSGDVYTSTDLSLLAAVAEAVSSELRRFDQEAVIREAREIQRELRRFVPGAVAQQVLAGADLQSGERPVSVLFVDIRGYSTYAESREAHEVFTTINHYTQTVSAIVEKFGGSVVEFNGDGMMAVFGAPTALPEKERAAVSAGREIISKVQALGGTKESETLSVGVGVATGTAFVGTIQAVDRLIWTALGNTTNLAARLQGLTRELDAAMVIDLATWRAAGEPREFQLRDQVPIRGRSRREDVYVLPLVAVAAPQ